MNLSVLFFPPANGDNNTYFMILKVKYDELR